MVLSFNTIQAQTKPKKKHIELQLISDVSDDEKEQGDDEVDPVNLSVEESGRNGVGKYQHTLSYVIIIFFSYIHVYILLAINKAPLRPKNTAKLSRFIEKFSLCWNRREALFTI